MRKDDVIEHLNHSAQAVAAPRLESVPAPRPRGDREERVKMTPLRRRVAERLLAAQSTAAILTTFNEVDMSEVMALRKRHGLLLVNPERHPHVKAELATRFADWLMGEAGQRAIAAFAIGGKPVFFPLPPAETRLSPPARP